MTYRYPGGLVRKTAANTSITGASGVWDLGSQAQAVKTNTWPISGLANPVSGSLRFRNSASAYLSRTPTVASGENQWTFSTWVKRGILTSEQFIIGGNTTTSGAVRNQLLVLFDSNSNLWINAFTNASGYYFQRVSNAVYRDPSAWYHLVVQFDPDNGTSANRIIAYINGQQVSWGTSSDSGAAGSISSSAYRSINNTYRNDINGGYQGGGAPIYFGDGYQTEINMVSGSLVSVSSFGQTSPITGVWEPIKYTGTYGTNGFYLSLSDTSSIGKDFSGNGNNWTPNNISTASGSTFDLMRDVPTQYTPQGVTDVGGVVRGNYATLNPLDFTTVGTISNGNLRFAQSTTTARSGRATFGVSSGKWYWEYTHLGGNSSPGIGNASMTLDYYCGGDANGWSYFVGGGKYNNDVGTSYGASYTTNDVIGVALDMDAGTLVFYKNGASQGTAFSSLTGTMFPAFSSSSVSNVTFTVNFGQQPFAYTPPSGFKSLCTTNLPTPTIGATVATAANKYFDATLYTGTGATLSVTNAGGFQPDFVWLKSRSAATNHQAFDAVRGATKVSVINAAEAESTSANTITSFNSNGFTVGTNTAINTSSATYVAWQWWAGGSTVTNTTGSISAQVRASTTTGFSIATYTGNGTGGATIGHGLGAAPSMLIFRNRDAADNSALVWHTGFNTNQGQMLLSSTAAIYNPGNGLYFNSTTPGASVVTLGTSGGTNGSGSNMIMYAWTPIAGFSAFGSYTGNGSTDGPFVFTGFRPRYVMAKVSSTTGPWNIFDSSRGTYNVNTPDIWANSAIAETGNNIDFLSNGFKIRDAGGDLNGSSATYIYMAFAENPFKNSLAR